MLFDLPLNPDLLEQRIGRLDRIGQRNTVEIHAPYFEGSAQAVLKSWYHEGINAFERTCPAGLVLYDYFEKDLMDCLQQAADEAALSLLLGNTRQKAAEILQALHLGRDRLLELNSFNEPVADEVIHEMIAQERRLELSAFMEQVFDQFGVEQEHHASKSPGFIPGKPYVGAQLPGTSGRWSDRNLSAELALSREDMQFLTWDTPWSVVPWTWF